MRDVDIQFGYSDGKDRARTAYSIEQYLRYKKLEGGARE